MSRRRPARGGLRARQQGAPGRAQVHPSLGAGTAVLNALGDDARGLAVARTGLAHQASTLQLTRDFQASMKRHDLPVDYDRFTGYAGRPRAH